MHPSFHLRFVAAVAATALVLAPIAARAQPAESPVRTTATDKPGEKAPGEDDSLYNCKRTRGPVTVSLRPETELKDLITWVMGFTCKNFIYDPSILQRSKKVTIISPLKMAPPEAYRMFLVALSTMGLTVVPKGTVLRVVESATAKGETVPVYRRGSPGNADEMVRLVLRPNYLSINELSNAISAVKSGVGNVQPVNEANALIVTDWASHIRDMTTLIRELDRPMPSSGIYTIKVVHADAKELSTKLSEILSVTPQQSGRPAGGAPSSDVASAVPAKILADDRTNTLILLANEAGYLRVRSLVKRLDVAMETEGAAGSIHVYQVEHANAETLAQTINSALQGQQQGPRRNQPGGPQPPRLPPPIQNQTGDLGAAFEGQVRVTHDAPTNSLVVVASGRDFLALKQVIRDLDIPRRQVFIEAVILEVQLGNDLDLGTSFHGGQLVGDGDQDVLVGGVQHPLLKSLDLTSLLGATGLISALIGRELNTKGILGKNIPSFGILVQALAKSANTNVLSSPHIIATDNEESEISVGQNIPYISGFNFSNIGVPGTGGTGIGGPNVAREKLNLTMKIKPHVNTSDRVRLDLDLEIKDIGERDQQLGPTWTERKMKTTVVVGDQQSIVIGGLMQDKIILNESKVPLLGDIPLLGYLFKFSQRQKRKTNLLVLLTPHVVKDQLDVDAIVERKVRERNEFVRSFTNLEQMKFMPQLDYRRKRGLIDEINRTVINIEKDAAVLRSFDSTGGIPEGPVQYDEVPGPAGDDEPEPTAPEAPGSGTTAPASGTAPAPGAAPAPPPASPPGAQVPGFPAPRGSDGARPAAGDTTPPPRSR